MINDTEHISTYLLVICMSSLEKMSIQVSIFNFLLSFMISFYVLDIKPLTNVWFAYFFYSIGCLFTLLMVPLAVQKLFSLRQLPLFIFYFSACALGIISPYHFQDPHQGPLFLSFPLGVSGNPKILTVILCTGFWGDLSFVGCVDTSVCLSVYGLNVVH